MWPRRNAAGELLVVVLDAALVRRDLATARTPPVRTIADLVGAKHALRNRRDVFGARADIDHDAATGEWVGLLKLTADGAETIRAELDAMREQGSLREGDVPSLLNRLAARGEEGPAPMELALGTRHELGLSWIVPMLGLLEREHPHLTLDLYFSSGPDLELRVRSGEIDCAVTSRRTTDPTLDRLDAGLLPRLQRLEQTIVQPAERSVGHDQDHVAGLDRPGQQDVGDADDLAVLGVGDRPQEVQHDLDVVRG